MSILREALCRKLDKYFADFVLPIVDPSKAVWSFSMSGGVDSWAARDLVRGWYTKNGITLRETAFHINQWNAPIGLTYDKQPNKVVTLSAQDVTRERLSYVPGDQAPCSTCSGVRHDFTDLMIDSVLSEIAPSDSVIVARGHHLSDLAVSLLWRYLAGREPASDMLEAKKGHPFQALKQRAYLAKPLIYVLKSELAAYADENRITGNCACVACPAHNFPSRRDIINETAGALLSEHDPFWELSTPGIRPLFEKWTMSSLKADEIRHLSQECPRPQHDHMPHGAIGRIEEFYDEYLDRAALSKIAANFSINPTLDDLALPVFLHQKNPKVSAGLIPIPKYLYRFIADSEIFLSREERMMLLCMGPFWASFILPQELRIEINKMRAHLFPNLLFDDEWSHVGSFVKWYSTAEARL